MQQYSVSSIERARLLRSWGKTYGEIKHELKLQIPKSTLSYWCKDVPLSNNYSTKIAKLNKNNLNNARLIAVEVNKIKRQEFLKKLDKINLSIAESILNPKTAKIALAMLCLGEARKYSSKTSSFYLGSSDPRIIIIFLELLKICFNFKLEKVRCTVQCRADQNIEDLEIFWRKITGMPKRLFYKAQIDPRTIGKPTKRKDYKGVLRIDYFDTKTQLELESLANLVYNQLRPKNGPEV